MATYLYCWELGGGAGHLLRMRCVAQGLAELGHQVTLCVPIEREAEAQSHWPSVIAGPSRLQRMRVRAPASYAELLINQGWSAAADLDPPIGAWKERLAAFPSARLLLDYAPNALLAARLLGRPLTQIGTGFYLPPAADPLPQFRHDDSVYPERIALNERLIVETLRPFFAEHGKTAPTSVAELFHHPDVQLALTTDRALDHYSDQYGTRRTGGYYGVVVPNQGLSPYWRSAVGPRAYAYLKPYPQLPALLHMLEQEVADCLVWGDVQVATLVNSGGFKRLRMSSGPINENDLSERCDVMIQHAGHDGSAKAMRAGLPLLQIPLQIEQQLIATRVTELGAGRWLAASQTQDYASALRACLELSRQMRAAAARYAQSTPEPITALAALCADLHRSSAA